MGQRGKKFQSLITGRRIQIDHIRRACIDRRCEIKSGTQIILHGVVYCAEFERDIFKCRKVRENLFSQAVQHLRRFHFFKGDALIKGGQKFRILAEHFSRSTDLIGKLPGESFFYLVYRDIGTGLALEKIDIVGSSTLKKRQAAGVFSGAAKCFKACHQLLIGWDHFCFHQLFMCQDQSLLF